MSTDKIRANVINSALNDYASDMNDWWDEYGELCESPIETAFLIAAIATWRNRDEWLGVYNDRQAFEGSLLHRGNLGEWRPFTAILPQAVIVDYRVDFLIGHKDPELDKYPRDSAGRLQPHWLIVECDGHEFHEKTKAQVSADKKRERELQSAGFKIFRFSGSDIFNRPALCAGEVRDYFDFLFVAQRSFA